MSIEGQGHYFTIYFPGFVCFVLYYAKISGERLQDHWSSGCTQFRQKTLVFNLVSTLCLENAFFKQRYITLIANTLVQQNLTENPCLQIFSCVNVSILCLDFFAKC